MPGTYSEAIELSRNNAFRAQVRIALINAAVNVLNESPETENHDRRSALAVTILRNPSSEVERISEIIAAVNPTIRSAAPAVPSDADVQFVVNQLFSIFAR